MLTSEFTTGPMPTTATLLSVILEMSSLFFSFSSANTSESPIWTEPSAICVMPWPEPPPWTVICTPLFLPMNCSAPASTSGCSAVEPTAVIEPERFCCLLEFALWPDPHPTKPSVAAMATHTAPVTSVLVHLPESLFSEVSRNSSFSDASFFRSHWRADQTRSTGFPFVHERAKGRTARPEFSRQPKCPVM